MEILMSISAACWLIGVYFSCKVCWPIIEQDGAFWVIRVGSRFVDQERMRSRLGKYLVLISGLNVLDYPYCKFESKEQAELYFKHVCNYTAEGKVRYL